MYEPDRIWTIPEAVQTILLIQTNSLINLGLSPHLKNIIGNMWLRFLAKIGSTSVPGIVAVVLTEPYKISVYDNLCIIYLALLTIDYPVLMSNILNWITDGTLCFFNTARFLPAYFKPRKLVNTALGVRIMPTIKSLNDRLKIVIDILDDIQKPKFSFLSLEKIFSNLMKYYTTEASDILFLCLGLYKRFYFSENLIFVSDLSVATSYLTSLRFYFQFENELSDKKAWLSWFEPFLKNKYHHKVLCSMNRSLLNKHNSVPEKHFLNLTLDVYLKKAKAITSQHAQVLKTENLTKELQQMFVSAELNTTKHQSANETENFRSKNLIKRGRKRKVHSETPKPTNRKIVVYPIDKLIDDTILPLELEILLDDVAAYFHLNASDLFEELQKIAQLCE